MKTGNTILVFSSYEILVSTAKLLLWCIGELDSNVLSCQKLLYC